MRQFLLAGTATLAAAIGLAGAAQAQVSNPVFTKVIAPGSVVVRLDGRISEFAGVSSFSGQNLSGTKYAGSGLAGYVRLYPGFDGVGANGLQYGAQSEIRVNQDTSPDTAASDETLYVLRAFGYLGLPQLGLVRFGQQEGALYLFDTGRFESGTDAFNDGGWNGDIQNFFVNTSARPVYPFTWSNNLRTTDKIDYISPVFSGFSLGFSFEPNQTAENVTDPVVSQAGGADLRVNTYEIGGRYKAAFGPVGVNLSGGYLGAGAVSSSTAATGSEPYQAVSVGSFGAEVTYAGLTFGGNTKFGNMNGQYVPNPTGASDAIGWLGGAVYTTGALSVGGSYFDYQSTGDYTSPKLEGQRRETGAAAGVTYVLVPGVKLFASYLYGTRHQGDYDFLTSKVGAAGNNTRAQVFALGTWIYW
jgi:predicted porin